MSMTILEAFALPDEFMHPAGHCGLCGNSGTVNTVGQVRTAAGVEVGIKVPCLCANGRAIKKAQSKPLTPHRTRKKPTQTFWVSWEDYSWKEPNRLGPRIISAWESGQAGDGSYATIVAWVIASNVTEVIEAIDRDYPCEGERRWRFINPCEPGWTTGDRFPLNKRAEAKLKKLKGTK
jgi:hypothetical protein